MRGFFSLFFLPYKPVGDVVFVPLLTSERVAFLPRTIAQLLRYSVWDATTRLLHRSTQQNTQVSTVKKKKSCCRFVSII